MMMRESLGLAGAAEYTTDSLFRMTNCSFRKFGLNLCTKLITYQFISCREK